MMIKILFMIPTLGQGGAEKVLVNLVNNMDSSTFDITVYSIFDDGVNKQFLLPHIKYRCFYKKLFRGNSHYLKLFNNKKLYKKMVNEKFDIVVSYLESPATRIISGCSDSDTSLVSWIHVEQHTKKKAAESFRNFNEAKKCYAKYNMIICVSEYVKQDFLKIFPNTKNIKVLYNTNETEKIKKLQNEKIDINIDKNFINICAIGTLKESKGFDRLIRIINKLNKDNLKIRLYILGKGHLEDKLKEYAVNMNVADKVFFLGYHTNLYKYLSKMDIFVCASFAEGFSTAATEALIVGIPVITVDVSGMKEMLGNNNEYGIVTKNDENSLYTALKKVITNREILEYYSVQAKKRGEFFSTENTVKKVENMFKELKYGKN